jgi:hypothetical protein
VSVAIAADDETSNELVEAGSFSTKDGGMCCHLLKAFRMADGSGMP